MRLFIAFMLLFVILGMFTRGYSSWAYFFVFVAAMGLAGTYIVSAGVW
jgi:hypothetical protein